ncbi:MAG: type II toxin-antitoxin system Phd/YefM family antitoxin [Acidobacteriota bacterium]|nr:type II toxin-antitoxin system Phd/YefM family antitoxin [Acidobacteriota bacterium]
MIELHPEFLTKNGKKEFAVLPYEEFTALQELLADAEDLRDLRAAKQDERGTPSLSLAAVRNELNIED